MYPIKAIFRLKKYIVKIVARYDQQHVDYARYYKYFNHIQHFIFWADQKVKLIRAILHNIKDMERSYCDCHYKW